MKPHVVQEGEYLTLIARRHRFVTNKALLDANAELFAERRDPNVLNPGDVVMIPDKRVKLLPRATGKEHTFHVKQQEDWLRLSLKDDEGRPVADQTFTLRVQAARDAPRESGVLLKGSMSGGKIAVLLPSGAMRAYLALDEMPWLSWELHIGHLDPTHDPVDKKTFVKGAQARLNNLGFYCGEVDGEVGPRTRAAIAAFQRRAMGKDEPSGDLDDETRDALAAKHGI